MSPKKLIIALWGVVALVAEVRLVQDLELRSPGLDDRDVGVEVPEVEFAVAAGGRGLEDGLANPRRVLSPDISIVWQLRGRPIGLSN